MEESRPPNQIIIESWMCAVAPRPMERLALAFIAARCRFGNGIYTDGVQALADYLESGRKAASQAIKRLCDEDILIRAGSIGRVDFYRINGSKRPVGGRDAMGPDESESPVDVSKGLINESEGPINGSKRPINPHPLDGWKDISVHPSNPSTSKSQVETTDEIATALSRLKALTENPNRLRHAEAPYRALISQGCAPDQIERAWVAWQDRRRDEVTDAKYMPQLTKWLEDGGKHGAAAAIARQKQQRVYSIVRTKYGLALHDPKQDHLIPLLDGNGLQLAQDAPKDAVHAAVERAGYAHG